MKKYKKIIPNFLFLFYLFFLIISLTSCGEDQIVDKSELINDLFPNVYVFVTQIISLIFLFLVVLFLLWKPIKKILKKRHDSIKKDIADAKSEKEKAMIEFAAANQAKIDAISYSLSIKNDANKKAQSIIENADKQAKISANLIIKKAENEIKQEKIKISKDNKNKVVNLAFEIAESILNNEVNKKEYDKFIDDTLNKIEKEKEIIK